LRRSDSTPLHPPHISQFIKTKPYCDVPCLSSNLGSVLGELQRAKKRALGKVDTLVLLVHQTQARHREAMRRGSTIIPLYNPADWNRPLPIPNIQNPRKSPQQDSLTFYTRYEQPMVGTGNPSLLNEDKNSVITLDVIPLRKPSAPSPNGGFIPPRRKRNPESVNRKSMIQTTPSKYARSTPIPFSEPTKIELFRQTGDVNSDAIYRTLFDEDLKNQSQSSLSSPSMLIVNSQVELVPPPAVQFEEKVSLPNFSEIEEHSFPLSGNSKKTSSEKQKSEKQKYVPLTLDPQVTHMCILFDLSQYRMLLARKKTIEEDPVLNFLMKSRPSDSLKFKKKT
jgi:hypothetical protein